LARCSSEGTPVLKVVEEESKSMHTLRPRWVGRCSMRSSATVLGRCWQWRCRPRHTHTGPSWDFYLTANATDEIDDTPH